jgi:hypothetical protein
MWRWLILIVLLGVKVKVPFCCVKFNYEVVDDTPAVSRNLQQEDAEKFRLLAPYLPEQP